MAEMLFSLFAEKLALCILVPRARRFLVTWSGNEGRLQIKPSGSGDENGHFAEVEKVHGSDDKAQIGHAQFSPCSPLL